ncbi:MAG: hypothetical protein ACPLSP_03220, partial [Fervidicoccus fontis]
PSGSNLRNFFYSIFQNRNEAEDFLSRIEREELFVFLNGRRARDLSAMLNDGDKIYVTFIAFGG